MNGNGKSQVYTFDEFYEASQELELAHGYVVNVINHAIIIGQMKDQATIPHVSISELLKLRLAPTVSAIFNFSRDFGPVITGFWDAINSVSKGPYQFESSYVPSVHAQSFAFVLDFIYLYYATYPYPEDGPSQEEQNAISINFMYPKVPQDIGDFYTLRKHSGVLRPYLLKARIDFVEDQSQWEKFCEDTLPRIAKGLCGIDVDAGEPNFTLTESTTQVCSDFYLFPDRHYRLLEMERSALWMKDQELKGHGGLHASKLTAAPTHTVKKDLVTLKVLAGISGMADNTIGARLREAGRKRIGKTKGGASLYYYGDIVDVLQEWCPDLFPDTLPETFFLK